MDVRAACDRASLTLEEFERVCCSYTCPSRATVYKEIWKQLHVCEVLSCERETRNAHDRYAVAVKMTGVTEIVGHLPTSLNTFVYLVIRRGKYFVCLNFVVVDAHENILPTKISRFTVHYNFVLKF